MHPAAVVPHVDPPVIPASNDQSSSSSSDTTMNMIVDVPTDMPARGIKRSPSEDLGPAAKAPRSPRDSLEAASPSEAASAPAAAAAPQDSPTDSTLFIDAWMEMEKSISFDPEAFHDADKMDDDGDDNNDDDNDDGNKKPAAKKS